jgi:methionine synthase II (cobalamin-independent)
VTEGFDPRITKEVKAWAEDAGEQLRRKKGLIPLKSCVTGPFTLAASIQVDGAEGKPFPGAYIDQIVEHPWVLEKLISYVFKVAQFYSSISSIVSVDEPYLSVLVGKRKNLFELGMKSAEADDLVLEALDGALRGIRGTSSIHVCGGIGRQLAEILLETSSNVLSHEFTEMTQNFDSYHPSDPERYSKKLSVGVVSTSPTEDPDGTEPQPLVEKRIESAVNRYGCDNILLSPDCGFMPLGNLLGEEEGYQLSMRKIRTMTMARRSVGIGLGMITDEKMAGD